MLSPWLAAAARLGRLVLDRWCGNPFISEPNASDDQKAKVLWGDAAQLIARHLTPNDLSAFSRTRPLKTNAEKLAVDYLWALMAARDYVDFSGDPIRRREIPDSPTWLNLMRAVRAQMVKSNYDVTSFWRESYFHLSAAVRLGYLIAFFDIEERLRRNSSAPVIKWADTDGRHAVREPNTQFVHGRSLPADDSSLLSWQPFDEYPSVDLFPWADEQKARNRLMRDFRKYKSDDVFVDPLISVKKRKEDGANHYTVTTWAYQIEGAFPIFQLTWVNASDALNLVLHDWRVFGWFYEGLEGMVESKSYSEVDVVDPEHHSFAAYFKQLGILGSNSVAWYLARNGDPPMTWTELETAFSSVATFYRPDTRLPRPTLYLEPAPALALRLACSYCKTREATLAVFSRASLHQLEERPRFACDTCKH